jgi:multiple sugar transport system substrate-binding protein
MTRETKEKFMLNRRWLKEKFGFKYSILGTLLFSCWLGVACTPAVAPAGTDADTGVASAADVAEGREVVEVRFVAMGADNPQGRTWDHLTQRFNKTIGQEKGIHAVYEKVPTDWQEYTQKVITQMAAGTSPDVLNLSPLNKPDFLYNDFLYDMRPLMEADGLDRSLWYDPTFDAWTDDEGRILGFGHGIYTMGVYYNKDHFAAAGMEPPALGWDESWTWDELAEYARALTEGEGPNKQYGFMVRMELGWIHTILTSFCGSVGFPDGLSLNTDSEGSIAALEYLSGLLWKEELGPSSHALATTPYAEMFMSGRVSMHLDGSWYMAGYAENITDFEWGVLPLPQGPCGSYTGYFVDGFTIPSTSENPEAAYEFIKFLVDEEASMAYVDNSLFGIPGLISVAEARADELFQPLTPEEASVWLESANYGTTPEYTLNWNQVWDASNSIMQRLEMGEISAAEAGELMASEARRLIDDVQ